MSDSSSELEGFFFVCVLFCFCPYCTPPHTHSPRAALLHFPNHKLSVSAEIELNTKCVVDMEDNQTVLHPPPSNAKGENR